MSNSVNVIQSRGQGTKVVLSVNVIKKQSSLYWHIYIGKAIDSSWERGMKVPLSSQGPSSLVLLLKGAATFM